MKKTFLYASLAVIMAIAFSSCLGGENGSTMTGGNQFVVAQRSSETNNVYVGILYGPYMMNMTADGISGLSAGDAALVAYSVNTDNWLSSSLLKADYITVNESFPVNSQKNIRTEPMDTTTTARNSPFKTVAIEMADTHNNLSNRWLFDFTADIKEGQSFDVVFSYDENTQKTKTGGNLPENTVIVDITLVKSESAAPLVKNKRIVANFTSFRAAHKPSTIPETGVNLNIWFRYIETNTAGNKDLKYWESGGYLAYFNESTSN